MVFDEAGTYTIEYTATDECGNTTNAERTVIVEKPITWADGTDEEIVAMVAAADRGELNLSDFWHVGDERVVHLSAMEAMSPLADTHAAQDVTLVLMNVGGKTLNSPTESGRTECSFIVGQKECLNETGQMNPTATNVGGWEACQRRTWCNNVYYNAIPSTLRPIFKQVKNKTSNGGSHPSASIESVDYFAMAAEYEVHGTYVASSQTYEADLQQFNYYTTSLNRKKRVNGSQSTWWERSPRDAEGTYFGLTDGSGDTGSRNANLNTGLAPFGCI